MTQQIFSQSNPPPFVYLRLYLVPYTMLGASGQLLVTNLGNPNSSDYETNCDFISVGLSPDSRSYFPDSWIAWNTLMPPNHMAQFQGICLAAGQTLFVYNAKGQCSFTFTGSSYDP
jgi:hypothetical protein